ncbi:hypothetical protein COTS27_01054 [Spirochaetota bacterium]|nr:hypothetical protein COTS27_01054 [Spirochaetota bacterium]
MSEVGYRRAGAILIAGGLLGVLAVILGAFSAHYLSTRLEVTGRLATFKIANHYHFIHTLALVLSGVMMMREESNRFRWLLSAACFGFGMGIILFSGSLYVLSLTEWKWLGGIAPVGGVFFILGWGALMIAGGKIFFT